MNLTLLKALVVLVPGAILLASSVAGKIAESTHSKPLGMACPVRMTPA